MEIFKNGSQSGGSQKRIEKDTFSNKNVLVWAGNLKQRLSNVNQTPVT